MKTLYIFKAVGSYFGGMAMATAQNEKEAFEKIKQYSIKRDKGNALDTEIYESCYFKRCYSKGELDKLQNYDDIDNGWEHIETIEVNKDIVFCEFHDG